MDVSVFLVCTNQNDETTLLTINQQAVPELLETKAHLAVAERHAALLGYSVLAVFDEFEEAYQRINKLPKKTIKRKISELPLGAKFLFEDQVASQNVKVLLSKKEQGLCVSWQGIQGPDLEPTQVCDCSSKFDTLEVFAVNEAQVTIAA